MTAIETFWVIVSAVILAAVGISAFLLIATKKDISELQNEISGLEKDIEEEKNKDSNNKDDEIE